MNTDSLDEVFEQWRNALLVAMGSPASVMAWQDRRYRFAHDVGQLLVGPDGATNQPVHGHALYGVYVDGGGLLYVGQTGDAKRRLRDLPVGESHHLATTVPAETWERVVVVQWPALIPGVSPQQALAAEQLGLLTCGLAMEYLLQVTYDPAMSVRRRSTGGGWTARQPARSRSRGAASSPQLMELFGAVRRAWEFLAKVPAPADGRPVICREAGRVVFPRALPVSPERLRGRNR